MKRRHLPWTRSARFAVGTFVAGVLVTLPSQAVVGAMNEAAAVLVLVVIVALGVLSDMIGVAATRAHEIPFAARASKKRRGALEGLYLVRHADLVATIASDVVGDLAGTISGALLAVTVWHVRVDGLPELWKTALAVGLLTGWTIGMKSLAKAYAVRHADAIVQVTGRVLSYLRPRTKGTARPRERSRRGGGS